VTSELTIAQRHLVATATNRLKEEFAGVFAPETIGPQRRPLADGCRLAQARGRRASGGLLRWLDAGQCRDPVAMDAMAEVGIDIRSEYPRPWTEEIVQAADVVVTTGCGDACPLFPGTRYEDWEVADPAGEPLERVRQIRDDIGARVKRLALELELMAAT
jgi:protein-tyrosine-phosphatase